MDRVRRQRDLFEEEPSIDLIGRRVLMAAYMYYVLDETAMMDDAEYDRLSYLCAKHWDELDRDRQWAFDTPEDLRASGSGFFFSSACVHAVYQWLAENKIEPAHPMPTEWKFSKRQGTRYVTAKAS